MSFSPTRTAWLVAVALTVCCATSSLAANEPAKIKLPRVFSVVPADILAVAAVTNVEGVANRATNLRKQLHLPDRGPTLMAMLKGMLGEHVDWKASAAGGAIAMDDAPPPGLTPVLCLPVTYFGAFVKDKDGIKLDGDVW
ncbi:MAG: hypothetical protein MI757_07185, partial [Pirellulales bacterium]|nr:hypothetical protein [Pirellulales bacterium]